DSTAMVFDGPRHDLAGAGAVAVDQQHERNVPGTLPVRRVAPVLVGVSPARGNEHALIDEAVESFDGGLQQATGITAQIPHQRTHSFSMQVLQGGIEFLHGGFLKAGHLDVGDAVLAIDDLRHGNALDGDGAAREGEAPWLSAGSALYV